MAVLEVAQFMGQNRFHFIRAELLQQGVEKHHALAGAKAREKRIGVGRAAAAVHHKKALGRESGARHQAADALFQGLVFQRRELVEQRHDDVGRNPHHKQLVGHQRAPGIEPPQMAAGLHQPKHQPHDRQAQNQA